jgi:hypothetical protein
LNTKRTIVEKSSQPMSRVIEREREREREGERRRESLRRRECFYFIICYYFKIASKQSTSKKHIYVYCISWDTRTVARTGTRLSLYFCWCFHSFSHSFLFRFLKEPNISIHLHISNEKLLLQKFYNFSSSDKNSYAQRL